MEGRVGVCIEIEAEKGLVVVNHWRYCENSIEGTSAVVRDRRAKNSCEEIFEDGLNVK